MSRKPRTGLYCVLKNEGDKMKLLTVRYEPDNNLLEKVCDGKAEKYVRDIVKSASGGMYTVLYTSQEVVINYVRLCILEGLISHEDVEFSFGDKIVFPDKYGHLDWWPTGFCDYNDRLLERLLNGMFNIGDKQ